LKNSALYWNSISLTPTSDQTIFTPTYSDLVSPARQSLQPLEGINFYQFSNGILADILSKREYLYRHYFASKGFKTILPDYFVASPKHPLMLELRDLTPSIDPVNLSAESSRDLFYHHSSIFNTTLIYDLLSKLNYNSSGLPININFVTNYLLVYLTGYHNLNTLANDSELLRNQYRPMKKGVSNMIKLHATGAVAMPIETRMHILASSKDVIHS
jgi:hypothetical protein